MTAGDKRATARELMLGKRVLVIAHRGDSKVAPENTLPAFRSAIAAGADMVELDYLHSQDGVPMVFHDTDLDRTTSAIADWGLRRARLADIRRDRLQTLDAGSWFDPRFAGTGISTLEEALDVIQQSSLTVIEHKSGDAATCVELLKRKGYIEHVVVQSFDWRFLAECHRLAPELALVALGDHKLTEQKLSGAEGLGVIGIGWNDKYTDAKGVAAIHGHGWKAWVWTADTPERWRLLIAMGIDGIITNRPGELAATLTSSPSDAAS